MTRGILFWLLPKKCLWNEGFSLDMALGTSAYPVDAEDMCRIDDQQVPLFITS
jgi:hypothetical protein